MDANSLASQPYFSLFPVGGDKEKYSWLARLECELLVFTMFHAVTRLHYIHAESPAHKAEPCH